MVIMVNQENLDGRRIYLNVPHSANVKPSWTGESVGHYEGDTLVVDTTGINDKTYIDNFRTPHTEKLHVVERFRMIDHGNMLEANIRIEDPGAFTMRWNVVQRWRRVQQGPMYERGSVIWYIRADGYNLLAARPIESAQNWTSKRCHKHTFQGMPIGSPVRRNRDWNNEVDHGNILFRRRSPWRKNWSAVGLTLRKQE
jgi:hypothetical protein